MNNGAAHWESEAGLVKTLLAEERARVNDVYAERNQLVAFLATVMNGWLAEGDDYQWPIVYLDSIFGQMSWHIPRDQVDRYFSHLEWREGDWWDGHSTEEKYARLAKLTNHAELW